MRPGESCMADEREPNEVSRAVSELVAGGGSLEDIIQSAQEVVRSLPNFGRWQDWLVTQAIRGLVDAERHRVNVSIRKSAGDYGSAPQGRLAGSAAARVMDDCYRFNVGGKYLGDLLGNELGSLAVNERRTASGYIFRAELLERLAEIVPATRTVRDSVNPTKLRKLFALAEAAARVPQG